MFDFCFFVFIFLEFKIKYVCPSMQTNFVVVVRIFRLNYYSLLGFHSVTKEKQNDRNKGENDKKKSIIEYFCIVVSSQIFKHAGSYKIEIVLFYYSLISFNKNFIKKQIFFFLANHNFFFVSFSIVGESKWLTQKFFFISFSLSNYTHKIHILLIFIIYQKYFSSLLYLFSFQFNAKQQDFF